MSDLWVLLAAVLGGGTLGAIGTKLLNRPVDQATANKIAQEAAGGEIGNLRQIIAEVRQSEERKTVRMEELEKRIDRLEERERHMLTRAAVHEAWDQMAFAFIVSRDASFPAPPPLSADRGLPHGQHDDN